MAKLHKKALLAKFTAAVKELHKLADLIDALGTAQESELFGKTIDTLVEVKEGLKS